MTNTSLSTLPVAVGDRVQFAIAPVVPGAQGMGGEGYVVAVQLDNVGRPAVLFFAVLNLPQLIMAPAGVVTVKILEAGALVRRVALS